MKYLDQITDVPGIRVGHWTNLDAATGCTVVVCPAGTVGGVDVRGAAPGTRETDALRMGTLVDEVHAVVLAGGSAFGLAAATGAMEALAERGVGYRVRDSVIPIVTAAVLIDFAIGRAEYPDASAGRVATRDAAVGHFEVGTVGAGTGATAAKICGSERAIKGGIGSASERFGSGLVVGALAAVNPFGIVREPRTGEILAAPRADTGGFIDVDAWLRHRSAPAAHISETANTTLAVVATNARLTKAQVNRLATVAHDGFATTIWPVHTRVDGDTVFALATGEIEADGLGFHAIEAFAVRAVERAILNAVRSASSLASVPSSRDWMQAHGGVAASTLDRGAARRSDDDESE